MIFRGSSGIPSTLGYICPGSIWEGLLRTLLVSHALFCFEDGDEQTQICFESF